MSDRYSAKVDLRMLIGDRVIGLAQVGRDHAVLEKPERLPKEVVQIQVIVDGDVSTTDVFLFEGNAAGSVDVRFF